jgi:hypothetical protein
MRGLRLSVVRRGYRFLMIATDVSEWQEEVTSRTDDTFAFGEPARLAVNGGQWRRAVRAVTGLFEERDRHQPIGPTIAKLGGVVVAITAITLVVLAALAVGTVLVTRAVLG